MKPKISIIIRCLNEEKHIGRLLAGIVEQNEKAVEIIVVDSGSTDATLSIAARFPTTIIQIRPEDFSFGYALNMGCAAATSDILLFASAHVYPLYTNWLQLMLAPFEDDEVALVYGNQRGNEVTKFSEHQVFLAWFPDVSTADQPHPFCNNANCAIRKSLWEAQAFDERLTGLEDLDWAKKIKAKGYKIAYQAEATIAHVHEEQWKGVFNRYRREAMALHQIFPENQFDLRNFVSLFFKNAWSDLKVARKAGKLQKVWREVILFRWMQFYGTYRGHQQSQHVTAELRKRFYYPADYKKQSPEPSANSSQRIDYSTIHEHSKTN